MLLHTLKTGTQVIDSVGRLAHVSPRQFENLLAFVLPYGIEHIASTGLELWLGALTYGFAEVVLLLSGDEDPAYRDALESQAKLANSVLKAYGFDERIYLVMADAPDDLSAVSKAMGALRQREALNAICAPLQALDSPIKNGKHSRLYSNICKSKPRHHYLKKALVYPRTHYWVV
ncbi:hypothetical protein [Polynucleobacter necessarius]|uniref:hypothetical protein n=1 Tax=Polynucleobacter necessarius TaxID=576610 RepID=UPI001E52D6E4|nr:hypothetical protein [Polynucleobacter necessarius]